MMSEAKEKMVFIVTHAGEDPERATFPFVMANAAQAMDMEALIILQGTGVYLGQKGYAEHISVPGLTPLKTLLENFVANGGQMLVCIPCLEERKISKDDLIQGAEPCKAGRLIVEISGAKSTLVY
jgi:predicted peroxiredoxin